MPHGVQQPLGDLDRILGMRHVEQDRELVAAEPGREVGVPDIACDPFGDPDQHRIAGAMTVIIVDRLELIQVDQ